MSQFNDASGTGKSMGKGSRRFKTPGGSPYQKWAAYPDSPVTTAEYPHQLICNFPASSNVPELCVTTGKFYLRFDGSGYPFLRCTATGTRYRSDNSWGTSQSFAANVDIDGWMRKDKSDFKEANYDVYGEVGLTTIFFAKTT